MLGARVDISPAPLSLLSLRLSNSAVITLIMSILLMERLRHVKGLARSTWMAGDKAMMGTQVDSPWCSVPLFYCLCHPVRTQVCHWVCKAPMVASAAVPVHGSPCSCSWNLLLVPILTYPHKARLHSASSWWPPSCLALANSLRILSGQRGEAVAFGVTRWQRH